MFNLVLDIPSPRWIPWEAGRPNSVEKQVPGVVAVCYKGADIAAFSVKELDSLFIVVGIWLAFNIHFRGGLGNLPPTGGPGLKSLRIMQGVGGRRFPRGH